MSNSEYLYNRDQLREQLCHLGYFKHLIHLKYLGRCVLFRLIETSRPSGLLVLLSNSTVGHLGYSM